MNNTLIQNIEKYALPFKNKEDLQAIVDSVGDSKYVLLGEASHGTSEFYTIRAELSKMLIEQKGFNVIAVEGDWPSCFSINEYIKSYKQTTSMDALKEFNRWPTWMWANDEIKTFIEWLHDYNKKAQSNVGFYGVDVYSLWESMDEILHLLEKNESADLEAAKKAFSCFEAFDRKPEYYGVSAAFYGEDCTDEVVELLLKIRNNRHQYKEGPETSLNLAVNSLVTVNAEAYYRSMVKGGPEDWNIRDHHMVSTIDELTNFYGPETKVIVWEHNTHIGDARATDMEKEGLVNVGQILREKYGEEKVFAVGFGTYKGTVTAAREWGKTVEVMKVPEGQSGSWEDYLHQAEGIDKILIFNNENKELFRDWIGHRAIGVVYNPEYEQYGNYVPSRISERYDAFVFVDETKALSPIEMGQPVI
ncbi:erythromycin esterase family protein [Cytobacillus sp. FJAT-54145]|uniref:Erythromycin esterase family protein n=1 Tax=Cytobacillus spartinae TaxID=3299023 RepID=A0ABW6K945_9BACI